MGMQDRDYYWQWRAKRDGKHQLHFQEFDDQNHSQNESEVDAEKPAFNINAFLRKLTVFLIIVYVAIVSAKRFDEYRREKNKPVLYVPPAFLPTGPAAMVPPPPMRSEPKQKPPHKKEVITITPNSHRPPST